MNLLIFDNENARKNMLENVFLGYQNGLNLQGKGLLKMSCNERYAWLRCKGILLAAWNIKFFKEIGNL